MSRRLAALAISLVVGSSDFVRGTLARWRGRVAPRDGVILYYHAIKREQRAEFARQMDELLTRATPFRAASLEGMTGNGRHVAVTFDDGFESVVENAVPELVKRSIPFTLFVPSGCLGQRPSWIRDPDHPSWGERVLSPGVLRKLAREPLATLGSHSITHRKLVNLPSEEATREMVDSRITLQAEAMTDISVFSFPHGAHTPELLDLARRVGYRRVFTVEPVPVPPDENVFTAGRVAADPDDWPIEFRLKLAGAYRWRHYLRRVRQVM